VISYCGARKAIGSLFGEFAPISDQHRLRQRDQQLVGAEPAPSLLERSHVIDGGVETLH